MDELLERLSQKVAAAQSLEGLVRPLLEMLGTMTGLESTYLTSIDFSREVQTVLYSRNEGRTQVLEGLQVQWFDTLCKRSLESGQRVVSNVKEIWGDSRAAAELDIRTYASAPVCAESGAVIGTLCGISRESLEINSRARSALNVFAKLISEHIERERLIEQLTLANEHLSQRALTDDATALPNRRALQEALGRLLANSSTDGSYVALCIVDLEGFYALNDRHGYAVGEQLLRTSGERMLAASSDDGQLAHIGAGRFAFAGALPSDFAQASAQAEAIAQRLSEAAVGDYILANVTMHYQNALAGGVAVRFVTVAQALDQADQLMLRLKRNRGGERQGASDVQDAPALPVRLRQATQA
ncbi:sensor domain-containing diguanylate cyclase [Paraburkholderia tropica]|uniref:sensor domain-containing diguanylate cyclase n=1 Tax=Paraburkholderia tropica TaxID=92647 RepID=UPI0016098B74|nr:sensor domain-containing diguanylate cyclase [Paraburkholderia tropica]MBB2979574.1 diguanylate cyclase [Paraburkholderia tropica]